MALFIARMIESQAKISIEKGMAKYRAYFMNTNLYANYRAYVDTILETDGYENVIVDAE